MTNTLTAEQIALGWILNDGKGPDNDKAFVQVYAPADGCELGLAEDFDFSLPSADDHDTDPIGSANNYFTMYRLLEPVRPSPPVSGEAVPVPININCPVCGVQHIDEGEWATRPHKTHECQTCGHEWRPFPYATVGTRLEGLSWQDDLLFFNGKEIGGAALTDEYYQFEIIGEWSQTLYTTLSAAKSALESAARAWLPPLTNEPAGVTISAEMLEFLRGSGPLEGVWFGEHHPTERGLFWWRSRLPLSAAIGEHNV